MNRYKCEGSFLFRFNIIFSIISGKKITISKIRQRSDNPGVTEAEVSFLRLIELITNGSNFVINNTGTAVKMNPGFLSGGLHLVHNCHCSRGLGYYLEPLLIILPFSRKKTEITLRGLTNYNLDVSTDVLRTVYVPLLKTFGLEDLDLTITKRGLNVEGIGEIKLKVEPIKNLKPVDLKNIGRIKRVRGLCYTCKISSTFSNRVRVAARGVLNNLLPDVWIYTEHQTTKNDATQPGYGLSLVAESTTKSLISVDHCAPRRITPELFGESVACHLLHEISTQSYISSSLQPFTFILMALTPEDISKVRTGRLTEYSIEILRTIESYFGLTFKLKIQKNGSILCACQGIGFMNFVKQSS